MSIEIMDLSSPRCNSDGSQNLKLSSYNAIQHSQPSSDSLSHVYSGILLSQSPAQPQGPVTGQNFTLQALEQSQTLTGSTLAGTRLHEVLAFGMDSYSPNMNARTVQGLQESLSHLRGSISNGPSPVADVSSQALGTALMLLQQKLLHLQSLVQLMAQGDRSDATIIQQQMSTAVGVATVISQLVTAAAGLLPQVHQQPHQAVSEQKSPFSSSSSPDIALFQHSGSGVSESHNKLDSSAGCGGKSSSGLRAIGMETGLEGSPVLSGHDFGAHVGVSASNAFQNTIENALGKSLVSSFAAGLSNSVVVAVEAGDGNRALCIGNPFTSNVSMELNSFLEDQDLGDGFKDDEDDGEAENLPPGSYELIELDAMEILAEHTHFCEICGKGFKRDANLRMHMRGHGDEYKTVAALSKPEKSIQEALLRKPRRYSCPYIGCKRNKKHKKFLPLKTMLCVKNHYRRSHCPKMLTCTKCKIKKFSVAADLKTHEKHCGRDKWQCSCGNTFSRKDKLLGHLGLFIGHTAASPLQEADLVGIGGSIERGKVNMGIPSCDLTKTFGSEPYGTFGARDGCNLGPDGVSRFAIGELKGSSVRSGGDRTCQEEMNLAAACFLQPDDGHISTSSDSPVVLASPLKQASGPAQTGSCMLQGLLASDYLQRSASTS